MALANLCGIWVETGAEALGNSASEKEEPENKNLEHIGTCINVGLIYLTCIQGGL